MNLSQFISGVGYKLTIEKSGEGPFDPIRNFLANYITEGINVQHEENSVTFNFEIGESEKIQEMLSELEVQKMDLNVINYGIEAITLEDVLIK